MERPGSLCSMNSMSRSSPESLKNHPTSQIQNSEENLCLNLIANSNSASKDITCTEGDRLEKVARKRKGGSSLHKIQASKRRRLRASSSNLSTKKEWVLTNSNEGATTIPISPVPGVAGVPKNSQDLVKRLETVTSADLAVNSKILAPTRDGSCRKDIFKKSNRIAIGGETGARLEAERKAPRAQKASHSKRTKLATSLASSGVLESDEQLVSDKQSTPECRALRPRRKTTNTTESNRVLQVVALSLADHTRIIGRRIKVFWPIDTQWYYGWVKEYNATLKLHLVVYDDHEQEWLPLHKEKFKLQVLSGETFGILGSTRSASFAAQGSSDKQEEFFARESGETARRSNGVKDGNAIGDDLLLSAVVPGGRLGGKFRKGLSNGTGKSNIPFRRTDGIAKGPASPVSSVLRGKKHAFKVLASRGTRESHGGAQTGPSNPIIEVQRGAHEVDGSVDARHTALLFEEKSILPRDACSDAVGKSNNPGDAQLGKSELVYVRRHVNGPKVRASLSESDVSRAQENSVLRGSGRTKAASVAVGLVAIGGGSQEEQSSNNINGWQSQKLDRASAVPLKGQLNLLESQSRRGNGNVVGLGDQACREPTVAREQKQHIVSTPHSFSLHNKSPTSSDLTFQDADLAMFNDGTALWEEKVSLGYRSRNVSLPSDVKVLGNRVYPLNIATSPSLTRAKAHGFSHQRGLESQQQPCRIPALKFKLNVSQQYLQRFFHSSLHLLRLDVVVLELFTWQLFNILKGVGFCNEGSFEERFNTNGSLQDMIGIVQLLLTIIKALPLSEWVHQSSPRHWQGRILHGLWNVLSGTNGWFAELSGVLAAEIGDLLVQHVHHFILEANSGSGMTFRQIFNILVCYFVKPYVIGTICEKGALPTVVIQSFLLSERSNGAVQGAVACVRQSVRAVKLRSGAGADLGYFSYLKNFPVSEDWCTENGLFQKQVKRWIATTACTGHAERSTTVPSVKFFNQLGLQVTTAHVLLKEFGSDSTGDDFQLEPNGGDSSRVLKSVEDCVRLPGEMDQALDERFGIHINAYKPLGIFSGLILTSMLQKCILSAGGESFSAGLSTENRIERSNVSRVVQIGGVMSSLFKAGRKVCFYNWRISVQQCCKGGAFEEVYAVEMEAKARQGGLGSDLSAGMTGAKISANRAKVVADSSISVGSTSSRSGYDNFGSVKHEGGLEMNHLQAKKDGSLIVQSTSTDTHQCPLAKDLYFTSGSPANPNLSFESTLGGLKRAEASGIVFRPHLSGDRCLGQRSEEPWRDRKLASYHRHMLDGRKRKRGIPKLVSPAYNDVSHLGGRRYGKRGRPSRQSRQDMVADQTSLYCRANLLITKGDRGWREPDIRVELQPNGSEYLIVVQGASDKLYAHKVQQSTLSSITNCYTHARMWKGGTGWTLEFCDRKQWKLFKGLYEECGHQNARAASVKQIPIPGVRQVQDFDVTDLGGSPFVRNSLGYIYQTDAEVEAARKSTCVIYDLDSEDEAWLTEINGNFEDSEHRSSKRMVSEDCLEGIIDRLEKVTHTTQEELVSIDDAVEICQDWGPADVVKAVYTHWCKKRRSKGTALVRQFQPPLWEQYEKQLQKWQASLNKLQMHLPTASKEQLLERCQRPPMFAFCLRPRGLDTTNVNKKIQKQRSQRKLSSVAQTALLAGTSEESQRVPMFWFQRRQINHHSATSSIDPDWHPPSRSRLLIPARYVKPLLQKNPMNDGDHEQLVSGLHRQTAILDSFTKADEAQTRAAAARERAGIKSGKSQRLFLKFDSALHRAVAALIEYEAIQFAELALVDQEAEVCSLPVPNEQLSDLKERVGCLSSQLLNLSEKSDDSGSAVKDESSVSQLDSGVVSRCDDGHDECGVYLQNEEFEGSDTKQGFMGYADALLPMPSWGHLDSWMGTTLLQRTDEGKTSQHIV